MEKSVKEDGLDLVFRSIKKTDEGRYTCQDEQEQQTYFDMFVVQPIDFGATPAVQSVQVTEYQATLKCNVKGHPFPVVSWRAKGRNLRSQMEKSGAGEKFWVDGTDLVIADITKQDEGSYLCKAVQTVEENDVVKYSDFQEKVITFKIERE